MSLKDLDLRNQYRSDRHNLLEDFYIPCLEQSLTYDRAVGFFSSTLLAAAARGLTTFIRVGGRMRLIASPYLSQEDAAAIAQGLKQREEVIVTALLRELEQLDQLANDRLGYLAWLLSRGLLEIKLAIHQQPDYGGLYHEKLGVFRDSDDNVVVFTGSANESVNGLLNNFECVDVFRSWRSGDDERIAEKLADFQQLWQNQTPTLEILDFPEAARRSLLQLGRAQFPLLDQMRAVSQEARGGYDASSSSNPVITGPVIPAWLQLRPYQEQAIANWFANNGKGTLKMATGSGKTITALAIAAKLYEKIGLQALIVVCPYRHLVKQWVRECQKFGMQPIAAYESAKRWDSDLSNQLINLQAGLQPFVVVVTTNATLITDSFRAKLGYFPSKTLIEKAKLSLRNPRYITDELLKIIEEEIR